MEHLELERGLYEFLCLEVVRLKDAPVALEIKIEEIIATVQTIIATVQTSSMNKIYKVFCFKKKTLNWTNSLVKNFFFLPLAHPKFFFFLVPPQQKIKESEKYYFQNQRSSSRAEEEEDQQDDTNDSDPQGHSHSLLFFLLRVLSIGSDSGSGSYNIFLLN